MNGFFDIDMQHCPNCGYGELNIVAAILERPLIEKSLTDLVSNPQPPPRGRAREPGPHFAARAARTRQGHGRRPHGRPPCNPE